MNKRILLFINLILFSVSSFSDVPTENDILESVLRQGARMELRADDLDCGSPRTRFKFQKISKQARNQEYNKADVCSLVRSYESHVFEKLQPFFPIQNHLGIHVEIKEDKTHYNASFNGDLMNPYREPYLNLIFVPGVPLEPQVKVWSHEYAHAVLDEAVRSKLNASHDFDNVIRAFSNKAGMVSRNAESANPRIIEIDRLMEELRAEREKVEQSFGGLDEAFKAANEEYNLKRDVHSELTSTINARETLKSQIENTRRQILNAVIGINQETPNFDFSFLPEDIHKMLAENERKRAEDCAKDALCSVLSKPGAFTKIYNERQNIINELSEKLREGLADLSRLNTLLSSYDPDLDQKNQLAHQRMMQAETNYENLRKQDQSRRDEVLKIQGRQSELEIELSLIKFETVKSAGISQLPGLDMLSNFHELFADLFAAVYHNNPNVIGEAFRHILGSDYSQKRVDSRSFSPLVPEQFDINEWLNPMGSPHTYFAPVRAHLNSDIITKINSLGKGQELLIKVLSKISDLLANYTLSIDASLFNAYEPLITELQNTSSKEDITAYSRKLSQEKRIDSAFIEIRAIDSWCAIEPFKCKEFLLEQLGKKQDGIFQTKARVSSANKLLLEAIEEVASEY